MPSPLVHVVAGVLVDVRGRILLARRTEGRDLAGLWEFPGGKVDPGETPEQALVRELREELGIEAEVGAPVIAVPQRYPAKRLRLDVRRITGWKGAVKGLDGQALAWVPPAKLVSYAMPPADRPVVAALQRPDRCLVTPAPDGDDDRWLATLQRALEQGVALVQLRAPGLAATRWAALATQAAALCRQAGARVFVNGDAALAARLGCGLHLRAAQLTDAMPGAFPDGLPLAASCHDARELHAAEALGCEFAVLGPVQPTPTHPDVAGIGWEGLARLREEVSLPIYAIGGLVPQDIAHARDHGTQGIAAIRGLWPVAID